MTRFHTRVVKDESGIQTGQENVPFTDEEEEAKDAEEATWAEERPARFMAILRTKRNLLLASSDWTQYNDSPLTDEVKAEWVTYRESLRDLPENTDDPTDPTWPTPPG